jgi:hypoxanthine phosphoribosyltransferase
MLGEKLVSRERLEAVIADLAARIDVNLSNEDPVFLCILKGATYFFTSLTLRLSRPVVVDFLQVSSYGASTTSSGTVALVKDLTIDISAKDVYIVEDIIDTGITLTDVIALVRARHPRSVKVVGLLSKPSRRKVEVQTDFIGIEIPDRFVVGFGLDFDERFRNLPEIWEYVPDREGP